MIDLCHREDELLDALGRGFIGDELAAHVAYCPSCTELRMVAGAVLDDHTVAMSEAHVPSAGTMWWRMQIRQRREAQSRARHSLLLGQAATLIVALTLVVALLGTEVVGGVRDIVTTIRLSTPLLIALASSVLLAPIAGWVAMKVSR